MAFWIEDNRIIISFLFALGGFLFFFLFFDSHYKELAKFKDQSQNAGLA
jgi:hypothetical protein